MVWSGRETTGKTADWHDCPHCGQASPDVKSPHHQRLAGAISFCRRCERRRVALGHLLELSSNHWWLRPLGLVAIGILADDWFRNVRTSHRRQIESVSASRPIAAASVITLPSHHRAAESIVIGNSTS